LLALFAAGYADGCYGTPRTSFPEDDASGTGGAGASGGMSGSGGTGATTGSAGTAADAGDAVTDGPVTGCSAICPAPTSGSATGSAACLNGQCVTSCNADFPTLCAASNACVDLTSDGKNCGTCGHDCLGGMCAGGQCQGVLIAQYLGHPEIIYVGAQAVYATTDLGYVGRASKDGADLKPIAMPGFASSAFSGTLLAEDGDRMFLVRVLGGDIQLSYCATSRCDSTAMAVGGPYSQYFAVDQADHTIMWLDYSPTRLMTAATQGVVSGAPVVGGALGDGAIVAPLFYSHGGVYFVADRTNISRIPVAGGSIASITSSTAPLTILGANSSSLFVSDGTAISSVPLPSGDGGSPHALIVSGVNTNIHGHFAADDRRMYWTDNGGQGHVCDVSNCQGTQKALPKRGVERFEDVGADETAVYLLADSSDATNKAIATVWKLAK
jgi:hypothetical protein